MSKGTVARRAVAIGGGTGLPTVLRCLLLEGFDTTAIVTVADDGGSSGLLREQLGILPPGDIRNCLVALSDPETLIARLFQYRFAYGDGLACHVLGNLIIAALADITGGFPSAIEAAGSMLGARGRVLPCTLVDVRLHAKDSSGQQISGQARLANALGPLADVELEPARPMAYGPALEAIRLADVVVIGPGSLFTSILPNFLVDGVAEAVRTGHAHRIYVCNVANQRGETCGMDAYDHVKVLWDHGLAGAIDTVLVHEAENLATAVDSGSMCNDVGIAVEPVVADAQVRERISACGPQVIARHMVETGKEQRHSEVLLRLALREVIG